MKIYIDADACPVKEIVVKEAKKREIPVVLVTSFSHYSNVKQPDGVATVYVDSGVDAADFKIMAMAEAGDIIITQDYGLASLALGKKCTPLHHTGYQYTNENIDALLQTRYLSAKARESGVRTKGPAPFTKEDKANFRDFFRKILAEQLSEKD